VLDTDLKTIVEDRFRNVTEEKELSPFNKPNFQYSIFTFLSLAHLKRSGETHEIHVNDDEVTLFFSDSSQ